MGIGTQLLTLFSLDPSGPLRQGATDKYTIENALDFPRQTLPDFDAHIRGKHVLDYGFGFGHQAVAMIQECGAVAVDAIDIVPRYLKAATELAERQRETRVRFYLSNEYFRQFAERCDYYDVVVSLGCFEHYTEPETELRRMKNLVKPNGKILITFAEPWYSHCGSHACEWCRLPWPHLFFSERTVMTVHNRYYPGATHLSYKPFLNQMTVARFEKALQTSGCNLEFFRLYATRGLPLVTKIPVLRELLTSSCSAILTRRSGGGSF